jgi:flagellar biogenesis protein FliO
MLVKLVFIIAAVLVVAWALGEFLRQRRPRRRNRRETGR